MTSPLPSPPRLLWTVAALATLHGCTDLEEGRPLDAPVPPAVAPEAGAPRLSVAQYRNAIHDIFGHDIVVPSAIEPDVSLEGFVSIGSAHTSISPRGVEQYEDAAFKIAEQVLSTEARRKSVVPCVPAGPADDACARALVAQLGRRVWRRPLSEEEVTILAKVTTGAGGKLGDFYQGAVFGIAALLQAPSFLYRPVLGETDPGGSGLRATSHEMASRLSFFLWNSTPDAALLDAADRDELTRPDAVSAQVERMLEDPRARDGLRNFVTENLRLDRLDQLYKDPKVFSTFSPDLGPAAREETLQVFEHLTFEDGGDYRDVFTSRRTFVNPKLASMYQVEAPTNEGFGMVELPADGPRQGLLGHISFLALYAHPTASSATLRGKLVRTVLLCGEIPPPPADVNTALPEPAPDALTLRERVKIHLEDPFCSSCHLHMDPIGLGLEGFDGVGRFRAKDNGAVIDASGDLDGVAFADAASLGATVARHPDVARCLVERMYEYATSSAPRSEERELIDALSGGFEVSGFRIKALMSAIATSPGFRLVEGTK